MFYQDDEYLHKALAINPRDDLARQALLKNGMDGLWYATHHLPDGYIGDWKEDLIFIDELQNHIGKLPDADAREVWASRLERYAELVRNYAAWRQSGHANLEQWGEENQKRVASGVGAYYYDK
jgi:hypothetical protein